MFTKNKMSFDLKIFLPIIIFAFYTVNAFSQELPTCFPYPLTLKNLPPSVRNTPQALKAIQLANSQPWFKKTIVVDFSNNKSFHWIHTTMSICPGVHVHIKATGEAYRNNDPPTTDDIIRPEGNPHSYCNGAYLKDLVKTNYTCGALLASFGRLGSESKKAFQVGSEYYGKATEAGVLSLGCDYFTSNSGYKGKWVIDIQLTAEDSCNLPADSKSADIGDVVMYWRAIDGALLHSGIVTGYDPVKCTITKIDCYSIPNGNVISVDPDDLVAGYGPWTVYHTDRHNGQSGLAKNIIVVTEKGVPKTLEGGIVDENKMGVTDAGNFILFYGSRENCHGYTFVGGSPIGIIGYKIPGDFFAHYNNEIKVDQGIAAELILRDNGYTQVHAHGTKTPDDHFNSLHDVQGFVIPH